MTGRGDLGRREYNFSWQSEFARAARRSGEEPVALARRSTSTMSKPPFAAPLIVSLIYGFTA